MRAVVVVDLPTEPVMPTTGAGCVLEEEVFISVVVGMLFLRAAWTNSDWTLSTAGLMTRRSVVVEVGEVVGGPA